MGEWITARYFGPGAAATGAPAELQVSGTAIEVRCGDVCATTSLASLRLREAGFGKHVGLELAWDDSAGVHAVHVFEPGEVARLRATPAFASSAQLQALNGAARRHTAGRGLGLTLVALLVLLPLLLILLFLWQADRLAGALIERIPVDQEVTWGRQAFAGMRDTLQLVESGPSFDAVTALGTRLSQGSHYRYEFHVARDASINAFALPGGIIVVHTGLIAATARPEELAGVLAHEIQHVEQRHSLKAAVKQLGLHGVWALVTGDLGGTLLGQAALQLTSLQFSRTDERSADEQGLDALAQQAIDPRGMIDFFATMQRSGSAKPPALLSTHPADDERQQALSQRVQTLAARSYPPLDLGRWPPIE